jgi:hypothetical protein
VYHLEPAGFAAIRQHLFVTNDPGNSVTEFDTLTGARVRVLSGPAYHFDSPRAMAVYGPNLFVANWDSQSVTEVEGAA